LQDELVHPAHPDVRSGRNQNNVEWRSRFHIPEDRAQPDESGDAIPIYVGATGLRSPRLGNEDAPPGVVLQVRFREMRERSYCHSPSLTSRRMRVHVRYDPCFAPTP
jgi:hypothetical protein